DASLVSRSLSWKVPVLLGLSGVIGLTIGFISGKSVRIKRISSTPRRPESDWRSILSFWFDGEITQNYRFKWFASSEEQQAEVDQHIRLKFSELLSAAERGEKELENWKNDPHSFVALVILLDQFSR